MKTSQVVSFMDKSAVTR